MPETAGRSAFVSKEEQLNETVSLRRLKIAALSLKLGCVSPASCRPINQSKAKKRKGKTGLDLPMTTQAKRKRTNDLQLSSWNVRTLAGPGAMRALITELRHYRCNITAIQETKWKGNSVFESDRFTVFMSGGDKGRTYGTGFVVDAKWGGSVIGWTPINGRFCVLRVKGKFFNYSIINVYATHNERPEEEKDTFYHQLERAHASCPRHDVKVVIGDFNAQAGREEVFRPAIGRFSLHSETNENRLRMINFAAANDMVISSTCSNHKNMHKATWTPPPPPTRKSIT